MLWVFPLTCNSLKSPVIQYERESIARQVFDQSLQIQDRTNWTETHSSLPDDDKKQ